MKHQKEYKAKVNALSLGELTKSKYFSKQQNNL